MGYPFHVVDWWRPFELAGTVPERRYCGNRPDTGKPDDPYPADARGLHGSGGGFGHPGMHRAPFAGGRRHVAYKVVSDRADKLLNNKLKSICRGCRAIG